MDLNDLDNLNFPDLEEGDECPKCEHGIMLKRYRRDEEGKEFLGCSKFPYCEFTVNL